MMETLEEYLNTVDLSDGSLPHVIQFIREYVRNALIANPQIEEISFREQLALLEAGIDVSKNGTLRVLTTSVTDQYEADKWGLERITMDGVQNHFPADSGGTQVEIFFKVNDEYLTYRSVRETISTIPIDDISEIAVRDDGKGFSYDNLRLLFSEKKGIEDAVGEKGEGLKMISVASIRNGLDFYCQSRGWAAFGLLKPEDLAGESTRTLQYLVNTNVDFIVGSTTRFLRREGEHEAFHKFASLMVNVEDYVLRFRRDYSPLASTNHGDLVEKGGEVFVKGMLTSKAYKDRFLFSYDLPIQTSRDRDVVYDHECREQVGRVLSELRNEAIIQTFIQESINNPDSTDAELTALAGREGTPWELWADSFKKLYGENVALHTTDGDAINHALAIQEIRSVRVPGRLFELLERAGIKRDTEFFDDECLALYLGGKLNLESLENRGLIETSIDIHGARSQNWETWAYVRDNVMNHVNYGGEVHFDVLVRTNGTSIWKPIESGISRDEIIEGIRMKDQGRGFHHSKLKRESHDEGAAVSGLGWGTFGEGMKRCDAYALADGVPTRRRSQDFVALSTVMCYKEDLGKEFLAYKLMTNAKPKVEGAETMFTFTDKKQGKAREILEVVLNIDKILLKLDPNYEPLFSVEGVGEIASERKKSNGGRETARLYNKWVSLSGLGSYHALSGNTLFNYNFFSDDSPDRNAMPDDEIREGIEKLLVGCTNPDVIKTIILDAQDNVDRDCYEFLDLRLDETKGLWKEIFERAYGKDAVLDTSRLSGDTTGREDAKMLKFDVFQFHDDVTRTLLWAGVPSDHTATSAESYDFVDEEELTAEEREILYTAPQILKNIRAILESDGGDMSIFPLLNTPFDTKNIRVYNSAKAPSGRELKHLGLWTIPRIYIKRSELASLEQFALVYKHEQGHRITGKSDYTREFAHYFEVLSNQSVIEGISLSGGTR